MRKTIAAAAVLVLAGLAPSARAGGQQVVAEATPDGRAVVVRTYRCGTPANLSLRGAAEGIVDGQRRTIDLEVVQLYIRDAAPTSTSSVRQLRGFERVALKAGERRTVRFTLMPGRDLARYDEAGKALTVDPGAFEIEVGASSRDLRLRGRVQVD